MGNHTDALPLCRQAADIYRAALGEGHPDHARSLNELAMIYEDMGDYAAALPLYRQVTEIFQAAPSEYRAHYAIGLSNQAGVYRAIKDYAAALPLLKQVAEIRRAPSEDHPLYADSLRNLAEVTGRRGSCRRFAAPSSSPGDPPRAGWSLPPTLRA